MFILSITVTTKKKQQQQQRTYNIWDSSFYYKYLLDLLGLVLQLFPSGKSYTIRTT